MPKCEQCDREFQSEAALAQHNADKHAAMTRHELKEKKRQEKEEQKKHENQKSSRKKRIRTFTIIAVVAAAVMGIAAFVIMLPKPQQTEQIGPVGSTHQHADFKVYINGRQLDFSLPSYQVRAPEVHVEGGNGDLIHKHATGVTVGRFFRTINFRINATCIVTENERLCSEGGSALKYFLKSQGKDWEQVEDLSGREIMDLDKYLITYGNETDLSAQLSSVTDRARIESASGRSMPL